jgi:dTDP-4-dehydrorhamnose 3,5-epimerase
MEFGKLAIDGVYLIQQTPFQDERGGLRRHYCQKEFESAGLDGNIAQSNLSTNINKGTLRGFHYQKPPFEENKTISCMTGSIFDVIVDLRQDSESYLKWISINLSEGDNCSLYVPCGCANAFLTLEANTTVHYFMSEFYEPNSYIGFRYDDPKLNIAWPFLPAVISEKDKNLPFLSSLS